MLGICCNLSLVVGTLKGKFSSRKQAKLNWIIKEGDSMRRVVITGLGLVAPTGNNLRDAWNATVEARSGITKITHFDASAMKVQIAGEVKNFVARGVQDA